MSSDLSEFELLLEHCFRDRSFLVRALTHRSHAHESKEDRDNETYEFLGDSVLGFVVGDELFHRFPTVDEGTLSKMKAFLVSARSLSKKAEALRMGEFVRLGIGEERSGGRVKKSLLANLYEAVIAAIYLDGGIDAARKFILRTFGPDLDQVTESDLLFHDYKTALQEAAQSRGWELPSYEVLSELGPDHSKTFVVAVDVGEMKAEGRASSKKEAQQRAARIALAELEASNGERR